MNGTMTWLRRFWQWLAVRYNGNGKRMIPGWLHRRAFAGKK